MNIVLVSGRGRECVSIGTVQRAENVLVGEQGRECVSIGTGQRMC